MSRVARDRGRSLPYVPALDGLRAVAVLAVLLYHGRVGWARGGFLGVDLFFVLSGFLITTLLLAEHARTGRVDLSRFWLRRARRLLPALVVVLVAVCVYAAVLAQPLRRYPLRLDVVSTVAYVANWRAALGHESYFAQYADPSPLRHMWSLGIEEQFYLLFPVLLIGWLTVSRGRTRWLPAALAAGALASAVLMALLYDPRVDPSRVYYGTDTRAQALLVGALAAVLVIGLPAGWGRWAGPAAAVALAVFVVLAALTHDLSTWLYRGGFLLVAVVCAVLVVGASRLPTGSHAARVLGSPPLRVVGLLSYGLYLWHWPVYVVLDPPRSGLSGTVLLLTRLAVTFALAAASYLLLERPVRRGALGRLLPQVDPRLAVAGSAAALVVLAVTVTAGAPRPAPSWAEVITAAPATSGDVKVYVLGDSVAWGLASGYRDRTGDGLEVRGTTELGCGLIAVPVVVDGQVEPLQDSCDDLDRRWPEEVAAYQPDVAVLMLGIGEQFDREVAGETVRFGTPAYREFLEHELDVRVQQMGGAGSRPVVLVTVPCHRVLDTGLGGNAAVVNDAGRTRWLNAVQRDYVARHADAVHLLDLDGYLCADGYRNSFRGVGPLRSDGLHFTPQGVRLVWRWLGPRLIEVAGSRATTGAVATVPSPSAVVWRRTAPEARPAGARPAGWRHRAGPTTAARTG